jgi:hypothetical protein
MFGVFFAIIQPSLEKFFLNTDAMNTHHRLSRSLRLRVLVKRGNQLFHNRCVAKLNMLPRAFLGERQKSSAFDGGKFPICS